MLEYFTAALREGDTTSHGEYELRYVHEFTGSQGGRHVIEAHHPEDGRAGRMEWMGRPPYAIHNIAVEPEHQRRGLATAMWNWAQQNARPKPRHSKQRTDAGDAWARSVGGSLPRRTSRLSQAQAQRLLPTNPGNTLGETVSIHGYFGGGHEGVLPDRTAGRGKPRRDRNRQAPPGGGEGGSAPGQQRGEAGEGGGRLEGPRPVEFHPAAHKDLKALDRPVQKQIKDVIDRIANDDPGLQTHALTQKLSGWYSTKASRGHRVVHRPTDGGGIHIGYVGLHEYDKAIRRLTSRESQDFGGTVRMVPPEEYRKFHYPDYPGARTPAALVRHFKKTSPEYYDKIKSRVQEEGFTTPVLVRWNDPRGKPLRKPHVMEGHHRAAVAHELGMHLPVGDYDNPDDYDISFKAGQQWFREHQRPAEGVSWREAMNSSPGKGPLPINPGKTWYRLHYRPRPWSDASSAELRPLDHTMKMRVERTRQPGFSAGEDPHDLHAYLEDMGWYDHIDEVDPEHKNHMIVQFPGKSIGTGRDGEDLVEPGPRADRVEIPITEFRERLKETPTAYEPGGYMHQKLRPQREMIQHLKDHHPDLPFGDLDPHSPVVDPWAVHNVLHDTGAAAEHSHEGLEMRDPRRSRRMAARVCPACQGRGEDGRGHECGPCDGSGRNPECPCGQSVEYDPQDGWQHADGSVSHDGEHYGRSVSDLMRTAVKPRPTGKLPEEQGLYWRLHRRGRPFSRQDATSQVFYKPDEPYEDDFDDPDDYRAAHERWTDLTSAKPGYSAYASPHHVEQYAKSRNLSTGDSDVVAFHGKQVGYGNDDEPLVMPHHDKPFMRMPYHEFQRRLRRTKKPWSDLELSEDDTGGYYDEDGLGGYFGSRDETHPLPERLYHVTTAVTPALEEGLKTRQELGQRRGHGLGGGRDDTISLTTHRPAAEHLLHSLHEYHDVLNGKITPDELIEKARNGVGAKVPYEDMVRGGNDYYERAKRLHGEHTIEPKVHVLGEQPEGWEPHGESQGEHHRTGKPIYMQWKRPVDPEERIHARSNLYKSFTWARQFAKGHPDPLFVQNDPVEFAKKDPGEFSLLEVRPKPGARGIRMNDRTHGTDAGEWRALSGKDLEVTYNEGREHIAPREAAKKPTYRLWRGEGAHDRRPVSENQKGLWFTPDRLTADSYARSNKGHLHYVDVSSKDKSHLKPWDTVVNGGAGVVLADPEIAARKQHSESCPGCKTDVRKCPNCGIKLPGNQEHCPCGQHVPHPDDIRRTAAHPRPTSRIFGPTYGLDHRLFTGDQLKPEVRTAVMARLGPVIEPLLGQDWQRYTKVYLAGSEASEWTSETLEGNGDFDTLIGVDYDHLKGEPGVPVAHLDDQDITDALNKALREDYNASPWKAPFGDEWDLTGYVNAGSYDIRKIKPYAAYNITDDTWSVRPPHLPDWSLEQFPEGGDNLLAEAEGYAAVVDAIAKMPEPFQTQQGRALWKHLHSDRGRAFSDEGEGWLDPGNAIEKILVEWGLWDKLVEWQYGKKKIAAVTPPSDRVQSRYWYHGTKHEFAPGDVLTPQGKKKRNNRDPNSGHHVYFTRSHEMASFAADLAKHPSEGARNRLYEVEPVGPYEDDPTMMSEAGGNPTGSYRAKKVRVIREVGQDDFEYDPKAKAMVRKEPDPQKTAAKLPEGLTFEHRPPSRRYPDDHQLVVHHPDAPHGAFDNYVGHLTWSDHDGEISGAWIAQPWQRKGIGTELFRRAKEITPELHHAPEEERSDAGQAWINSLGSSQEPWVEHVRVDKLLPHREWQHQPGGYSYTMDGDGPYAPKHDAESWEANKRSVAEEGVREPLTLKYNPTTHSAYLGEGNHRLHWARELGHQTVPVRMWRTSEEMSERYRIQGEPKLTKDENGYFPQDGFKPSDVLPADYFPSQEKTAGARGDRPELTFKHLPPEENHSYGGAEQDTHTLHAYTRDGKHAGELSWFGEDGMIRDVNVHDSLRRRGIASELLSRARQIQPSVHHSDALTSDGAGWARKVSMLEYFAVKRSDHPLAPDMPQEQHDALDTEDYTQHKRKMLDLAKNPVPGTHIWRGEVRAQEPVRGARETGVGIHWGVNPDTILRPQAHDGEHEVVYHAEIEHPGEQNFSRSHPMWQGRHMSLDSEAEVRLKPGTKVKLHGVWYRDPYVSEKGYFTPTKPERMGKQWSYTPINEYVDVAHRPTTDLIDYSDVGIKHEGILGYFTAADDDDINRSAQFKDYHHHEFEGDPNQRLNKSGSLADYFGMAA